MSKFSAHGVRLITLLAFATLVTNCGVDELSLRGLRSNKKSGEAVALKPSTGSGTSQPASKATAAFSDIAIMDQGDVNFTTILTQTLKTSNRSLFIDMALECGLLTKTTVKSKGGKKDTSTASAAVMVRVLVDGNVAAPGEVTYCQRTQELSATFGGILQSCTDADGDGTILASECEFADEELSLLLSTMNAGSFNFLTDNLTSGVHTIEVQAKIFSSTTAEAGSSEARGFIGKGSVLTTSERLAR
ncbi:hypothetical protein [Oligoflexus tunisiensis]|uniref:hypothetical protein n=1 Tax=Oligoflexus tunisiensis TaxID=708132 RepID=UPI00114CE9A4|nr:hypothetical protein [Oligoflexus tunisiensis]